MSVKYKMVQDTRKNSNYQGYWYGRAVTTGMLTTDEIVERITEKTTLTEVEVVGVVRELVTQIRQGLRDGLRVELEKFGYFKVGIHTKGAEKPEEFSVSKNIVGVRVIFQPWQEYSTADKKRIKSLLTGVTLEELTDYASAKKAAKEAAKAPGEGQP